MLASILTLTWYWKLLLFFFLLVFAHLVWGFFLYHRWTTTRAMRKIFAETARHLGNTTASEQLDTRAAYLKTQCDALIFMALKSRLAADYEDHNRIEKWRSKQREEPFNEWATRAKYFETLSNTLTFSEIEPSFDAPKDLDTFLASDIGRIRE